MVPNPEHQYLSGDKSVRKSNVVEQVQVNKPKGRIIETTESIDPLISVIVPIYNVEKYIRECLDSLKTQTMSQIEIICIDDGSTDRSGVIADEYENKGWPIFRVIHTENRGLSAARNRGIDEARADWIMFVDSDDWVEPEFCRVPYEVAIENQAELVIFDHYIANQKGKLKRSSKADGIQSGIVTTESVIRNSIVWNKLYKKSITDNVRYPEERVYEDIATTHKIIFKAERIYLSEERLYYYRKRKGSITESASNRIDAYVAKVKRYKDLIECGYATKSDETSIQTASLDYCGQATSTDGSLYQTAVSMVEGINKDIYNFDLRHRVKLLIWRINRNIYSGIYRACGKKMK